MNTAIPFLCFLLPHWDILSQNDRLEGHEFLCLKPSIVSCRIESKFSTMLIRSSMIWHLFLLTSQYTTLLLISHVASWDLPIPLSPKAGYVCRSEVPPGSLWLVTWLRCELLGAGSLASMYLHYSFQLGSLCHTHCLSEKLVLLNCFSPCPLLYLFDEGRKFLMFIFGI